MTTYFGNNVAPDGDAGSANAGRYMHNDPAFVSYLCPGSGTQNVQELSVYLGVSGGNVRLAIYSVDGSTLVGQGSSEVAIATGPTWQGHMTQSSMSPNPTQLTGGVEYLLVFSLDNSSTVPYVSDAGDFVSCISTSGNDKTGGFSATITVLTGDLGFSEWLIRCGVDAAASIEQEGFRFRNDDGSETTATWKASQDTNLTLAADTSTRFRMLLNATGDPASIGAQLEYRYKPSGGAFGSWKKVN